MADQHPLPPAPEQPGPAAEEKPRKAGKMRRFVLEWLVTIAIGLAIALFITNVIIVNAQVPTGSMEPTIQVDDRVIGLRLSYLFGEVERGDIVIFRYPDDETQLFVKRVIGLPGETLEIRGGRVYINNAAEPLSEPYVVNHMDDDYGPITIPDNSYFVMGDNRPNSRDSRYWQNTFVTQDAIIGRAWVRVYPNPTVLE